MTLISHEILIKRRDQIWKTKKAQQNSLLSLKTFTLDSYGDKLQY